MGAGGATLEELEPASDHTELRVRRHDVHVVGLENDARSSRCHGHLARMREELHEPRVFGRNAMLNDHHGDTGRPPEVIQKLARGIQAAGGRADGHHG